MKKSLLFSVLLLSACAKDDPEAQLPAETRNGANTFGCLVNGKPWTPQGNDGTANYTVSYDRVSTGETLDIRAYRIYESGTNDFQNIVLFATQLNGAGTYSLASSQHTRASFNEQSKSCYWSSRDSTTTYRRGALTITRLDMQAGIVSGTFWLTLYKPGCDSIRVTNGRFDKKLYPNHPSLFSP